MNIAEIQKLLTREHKLRISAETELYIRKAYHAYRMEGRMWDDITFAEQSPLFLAFLPDGGYDICTSPPMESLFVAIPPPVPSECWDEMALAESELDERVEELIAKSVAKSN